MKRAPQNQPIAFVSDIHGNLRSLKAVVTELSRRGVRDIVALGDHLVGGDAPLEVWRLLQSKNVQLLRGVSDTALVTIDPEKLSAMDADDREKLARFRATRDAIGELVRAEIKRLPEYLRIPLMDGSEIVATHGAPSDSMREMSIDMEDDELVSLIADDPADLVVCGGTHVPFLRVIGELRIANVGSVGAAFGGVSHFTIVTPSITGFAIEQAYIEV